MKELCLFPLAGCGTTGEVLSRAEEVAMLPQTQRIQRIQTKSKENVSASNFQDKNRHPKKI